MALELIVNVLLLAFSIFCYFYVGATMPKSAVNELGAEQWPQALLIIMTLAICWNIIKYFKGNPKDEIAASFKDFLPGIVRFLKSKLFIGMVILMIMALCYEPVGFLATSLLFLAAYGFLLGERRIWFLAVTSVIITLILYVGFAVFLGVMLPRGNIGFLRSLALMLESVFQGIG